MSHVSSYMFVTYDNRIIEKISKKLSEIEEREIVLKQTELNEVGGKSCQFGDFYFFAGNYFNDDDFQNWIHEQKFDKGDIQIFFSGEHDEYMREI